MKTINATVTNQLLNIERSVIAVSNSVGEYQLKISFDTDWDEVDRKVITFASENGRRIAIEYDEENGVLIPWEVLANRTPKLLKVSVGAIGYSGTAERITTSSAYDGGMIFVLPEALGLSCAMTPSPDIYQKLIQEIGNLDALKTEDKDSLVSAINEIVEGGGGGGGTVTSVNDVLPDENGNINLTPADIDAQAELTSEQQAAVNSGITAEKVEKLEGIEAGAEANTIESVSVNGTAVTPDENKNVNIPVPSYSDFVGTDGTAAGTAGLVPAPATTDANKVLGASGSWVESMKSLTPANYNYPADDPNPTAIGPWLLDPGVYRVEPDTAVRWGNNDSTTVSTGGYIIVANPTDTSAPLNKTVLLLLGTAAFSITYRSNNGTASSGSITADHKQILTTANVINNLTTPSYYQPLSAAQGSRLRECIDGQTKSHTIATADWTDLSSSEPYNYQTTVASGYANFGTNTIAELLNDNPVLFATHGFAIASMDSVNKTITLYSIGLPSSAVTLNVNYKEPA